MGFWKALEKVFPTTRVQRCTVHKTANVHDKMPRSLEPQAKRTLQSIWDAPKKEEALKAFDLLVRTFEAKHLAAVECLRKDREVLLTFYDSPAENWCHIRELIKGIRFIDGINEKSLDELRASTNKSPTTHTEVVA